MTPARHLLMAALLGALTWLPACQTTQLEPTQTLAETVPVYRLSKGEKAMAVAADEDGRRTWGVSYGELRQPRAIEKAMETCERNASRVGVRAPCYLFAVGDQVAQETVRACAAGRIAPRRCDVQARFGW